MDGLQRKLKTKNLTNYNPAKVAALSSLDRNIASRGGGDAARAAQVRIAEEQKRSAQEALDEEQQAEDEMDLFSSSYNNKPSSSKNGGGGGSSREGGAGKGKEREKVYVPSAQTEADRKKQARAKQREEAEKGIRQREMQQKREAIQAREREEAGHRGGGGGGSSRDIDSDDDDDDDLPEVGKIGASYGRAPTKATSSKESSKSAGKRPRQRSFSPPPRPKLKLAASPSLSPPRPLPPKQAPLPNFKKKANTTSSTSKPTKDGDLSTFLQPNASTSTTSSSSKRPIHDLDSPERDLKPKPLDLDTSSSSSRSPSPPRSRNLNGSTSRPKVPPRSDSSDMESVEDALSPQKPPAAARPKPKAKTLQGVVGVGGVSNPFGVKTQPIASSSTTTKHLQPSNSDAPPFAGSKPSNLASSSSKPSKIKKTSSAQLPDSSEEESEEEKDTVRTVGGVALVSMARKKVKLTPGAEAKRKAAEVVRAAMEPGEEFDDLVETEEDEEEEIVVDLRKKVAEPLMSKEGKSELKATAKRSRILELATSELEAGMKEKAAKERKVELYGEDDEVYETDHPHPHPELLCIFCSELLPPVPSPKLLALILRLKKLSRPAPTIFNPRAVSLSMIKSINACTLHRSESKQFPIAKKNGWPMEIDWAEVQRRVKDPKMVKHLGQIIESKDSNPFLLFAKERAEDVGVALARTAKGQYEVFEKAQPGYFGEIGQILFHQMLSTIFIPSRNNTSLSTYGSSLPLLTSAASSPLTPSDFVYFVLIPELALKLIQQDLGLQEYIQAYNVMLNSRAYGNSRFAAEEGEAAGGVLMQGWDEDGEEMHDGADDGILVSRRKRVGSGDGESSKGKGKGKEVKSDASKPSSKGLRPPSSPPSDDGGPPTKKPTAVLSSSTTTTSSTNLKPNPFTLNKRPRSASPNPPPRPSKRPSLSRSPPPPKSIKAKPSPSTSTPKPPAMHPFFKTAKKEPTAVVPPSPPSTSSSTSKDKPTRPKPKPALAPPSSSSTATTANAIAGSSKPKPKPKPRLKSPVKIDLDSDEDEDAGEQRRKEERDKTVTPPKQPKKRKENEYMELEEDGEGESQETTVPESPKGKKGRKREEEEPEEGKKSLKRTHSMKRTESENQMWDSMPSDGVDFDEIFG